MEPTVFIHYNVGINDVIVHLKLQEGPGGEADHVVVAAVLIWQHSARMIGGGDSKPEGDGEGAQFGEGLGVQETVACGW